MGLKTECRDGCVTVWLSGEIDHHTACEWRGQIDYTVERGHATCLRLDFSDVTFMDSSGVGLIMGRYRLMNGRGGRLVIVGASDRLATMMRMAGLDRLPIWEEERHETHQ